MRKIVSVLTLLLVLWTLCGCSAFTSAGPSEEGEGSSAIEAAAPAEPSAPSPSPMPTPKPEPVTVAGQVVRASKSVFELRLEDGSALTVVITDETQVTGDALLDGCQAAVTYDKNARTTDTVPALAVELTAPEEKDVPTPEELLSSMTLEEKVGQLFFVRVPKEDAAETAARYQFGGYILFGRDFADKTRDQVREDIQSYQDSVGVPMLIGVDEEGGTVVRVSSNPALCPEPYLSPRQLYEQGGLDLAASVEQEKIHTLQDLGINVNFAPVCDVTQEEGAFMYDRSLGRDPETTAAYVERIVSLYGENGMGCVLKHFPGYGNNEDTHTGVALDERPYDVFRQQDFLPFQAGIQAGAGCVLVCHNIVSCGDGERPASLAGMAPGSSGRAGLYRLHHHRRPGDGRHPAVLRRLQRGGAGGAGWQRPAVLLRLRDPVPRCAGRRGRRANPRGAHRPIRPAGSALEGGAGAAGLEKGLLSKPFAIFL